MFGNKDTISPRVERLEKSLDSIAQETVRLNSTVHALSDDYGRLDSKIGLLQDETTRLAVSISEILAGINTIKWISGLIGTILTLIMMYNSLTLSNNQTHEDQGIRDLKEQVENLRQSLTLTQ